MISIITICFNAAEGLRKTINSILQMNIHDLEVELVIVDGASSDNTDDVVKEYIPKLNEKGISVNYKSEKDNGIYDAMNIGAQRAAGEWCLYLNAGDRLVSENSFYDLCKDIDESVDFIYGDTIHCYNNKYKLYNAKEDSEITYMNGMEFCHQSCLMKRSYILEQPYTQDYRIAGDFEFFVRAFRLHRKFMHKKVVMAVFEKDGISSIHAGIVNYENTMVLYKAGMIDSKSYHKRIFKAKMQILIRKLIPDSIITMRRNKIMAEATKNWSDSIEEALRDK